MAQQKKQAYCKWPGAKVSVQSCLSVHYNECACDEKQKRVLTRTKKVHHLSGNAPEETTGLDFHVVIFQRSVGDSSIDMLWTSIRRLTDWYITGSWSLDFIFGKKKNCTSRSYWTTFRNCRNKVGCKNKIISSLSAYRYKGKWILVKIPRHLLLGPYLLRSRR